MRRNRPSAGLERLREARPSATASIKTSKRLLADIHTSTCTVSKLESVKHHNLPASPYGGLQLTTTHRPEPGPQSLSRQNADQF